MIAAGFSFPFLSSGVVQQFFSSCFVFFLFKRFPHSDHRLEM